MTARSATITIVAQIAARGVSLLAIVSSTAIVARTVSIDVYAQWGTVVTLTALMAFALDPGVSPVVVRRLAQEPARAPLPGALIPLRLALGAVSLAIVVLLAAGLSGAHAALLGLCLGGQLLPRAAVLNATPWLQLDHRLHRQAALEALTASGGLALLGTAALLDAPAAVLALVGFTGPTTVLALLIQRELRRTPSRARDVPGEQRERVRSLIREVAPLALALLLVSAYTRTAVFFLNLDADDTTVARFLFAFQFIEQVIVVAGIVGGALLPMLASRSSGRALLADAAVHETIVVACAIGALITAVLVAMASPVTDVIGGPKLAPADHDLRLLAPAGTVLFASLVLAYVYIAAGRGSAYLRFNLVVLAANLLAGALLTSRYGAEASARIAWGSEALVVVLAAGPLLRSATGVRALAAIATLVAAAAAASELAAAGTVAPVLAAAALAAIVAFIAGRPLQRVARAALAR